MGNLHAALRKATKDLHGELDHHPLLAPLLRKSLTRRQYGDALGALHGIFAALEEAVWDAATQAGFDYRARRKILAMEADLRELGQGLHPCRISIPAPQNMGALIGMLYTLEGSTLGAQAIARQLPRSDAWPLPIRYFSGYGDQTLARWQAFWDFADRVCPAEAADEACMAAVLAFEAIKRHLDEVLVGRSQEPWAKHCAERRSFL